MLSMQSSQDTEQDPRDTDKNPQEKERSDILETIFTVLSLILIAAVAGYLIWQTTIERTPPAFEVKAEKPIHRGQFQAIKVSVRNTGSMTAKAVNVSGEAVGTDGKPVNAEASIDWLPGQSMREVTLIFPEDSDTSTATLEITGYQNP